MRHSSTLREMKTAPGTVPSRARWLSERMSTSSAPPSIAANASFGPSRRSRARLAASTSWIVRRATDAIVVRLRLQLGELPPDVERPDPLGDEHRVAALAEEVHGDAILRADHQRQQPNGEEQHRGHPDPPWPPAID